MKARARGPDRAGLKATGAGRGTTDMTMMPATSADELVYRPQSLESAAPERPRRRASSPER